MSRPFEIRLEQAYARNGLFAIELVDAVTLDRVSAGVKVVAHGLTGEPVLNAGGLFVWLKQDVARLRSVSIDPRLLPYEKVEITLVQLNLPPVRPAITTIELPPRADYAFATGITGLRGTVVEDPPPRTPVPVADAEIHLRWLDEDGVTWRDAPTASHTGERGDFVSIVRLAATQVPLLDSNRLTVRLRVRRGGFERGSDDLKIPQGRVADPSTLAPGPGALPFAWDDLQP